MKTLLGPWPVNTSSRIRPETQESYTSSRRFFLLHLPMFEIRANHLIRWIFSTLTFFLLLPSSSLCATAAPDPALHPPLPRVIASAAHTCLPRATAARCSTVAPAARGGAAATASRVALGTPMSEKKHPAPRRRNLQHFYFSIFNILYLNFNIYLHSFNILKVKC